MISLQLYLRRETAGKWVFHEAFPGTEARWWWNWSTVNIWLDWETMEYWWTGPGYIGPHNGGSNISDTLDRPLVAGYSRYTKYTLQKTLQGNYTPYKVTIQVSCTHYKVNLQVQLGCFTNNPSPSHLFYTKGYYIFPTLSLHLKFMQPSHGRWWRQESDIRGRAFMTN